MIEKYRNSLLLKKRTLPSWVKPPENYTVGIPSMRGSFKMSNFPLNPEGKAHYASIIESIVLVPLD